MRAIIHGAAACLLAAALQCQILAALKLASSSASESERLAGRSLRTRAALALSVEQKKKKSGTYAYPKTDNLLLCFMVGLRHRVKPTHEGEVTQLGWQDPELEFWRRAQSFMQLTSRHDYLDVGCGMGRVVAKFGGLFDSTTCLEPDANRVTDARKIISSEPFGKRIGFTNTRFLDFTAAPESYDVISCVQVIQHLPLTEPTLWFKQMHALLRPGGILVVATTIDEETTYKATDGEGVSWYINATEFDARASDTTRGGALPVHHFTADELAAVAAHTGFRVLEQQPFSFMGAKPCSQYLVAVKKEAAEAEAVFPRDALPPPSPRVKDVHVSGMEEFSLTALKNIRLGLDPQCKKQADADRADADHDGSSSA